MTLDVALLKTLVAGYALLAATACLWLWQILSAPDRPNYPTSGRVKRLLMFLVAAAFAYCGLEVLYLARGPDGLRLTDAQAVACVLLAGLFAVFLVDHVRNWLPARTHHNIRRLMAVARCRPRNGLIAARTSAMMASTGAPCPSADVVAPALMEMALQGVRVVGPGEGPGAIIGEDPR